MEEIIFKVQDERDRVQKKTFTKWVNKHLMKVRKHVNDMYEDLRDGHNLISLLEVLSGEKLPREKGRMRFHRLHNVQIALDFLRLRQIKLVNIRSDDIADGNPKLTLGLIWTIILHFQIADIQVSGQSEDMTAKDRLLLWSQRMVEGYPGIRCDNFTTSWRDGRLFNAIIHRHRPELIDMKRVAVRANRENLEQAFTVAEHDMGVTRLLDPEDVDVPSPDEKSIITYVSSLYDVIPRMPEVNSGLNANEVELRWTEYQEIVVIIMQWIRQYIIMFQTRANSANPTDLRTQYNQLVHFREVELPAKEAERLRMKSLFMMMENLIQSGHIKMPVGYHPSDMDKEWNKMLLTMSEREREMKIEIDRLDMLQRVAGKIQKDALVCEDRLNQSSSMLQMDIRALENHRAPQHEADIERALNECDAMIRELFIDVQTLKDGRFFQAELMYRRVFQLHERFVSIRSEYKTTVGASNMGSEVISVKVPTIQVTSPRPQDDSNMKYVRDLLAWVEEHQAQIEKAEWGTDLPSVEGNLEKHREFNRTIEDFRSSINEAKAGENMSRSRLRHLESLHAFVVRATKELMWLNDREEEEVNYDWSERNPNMSVKKEQHAVLMKELEQKESIINGIQDSGEQLLASNHPARQTIESYLAAMQTQWNWILQICCCIETHIKENTAYFQFFKESKDVEEGLKSLQETIRRKYTCDKASSLTRLEDIVQDSMDEKEQLLEYKRLVSGLVSRAKTIVQLKPRSPENRVWSTLPVKAICDFKQQEITIYKNDECVMEDNAQCTKWKIINPIGNEALVPSVCFLIAPPNKDAIELATRMDQSYQNTMTLWHQLHVNMKSVISYLYLTKDIECIRSWTVTTFKTMPPDQYESVMKNLEVHYEDFLEDSRDSQLFSSTDRMTLERDMSSCKQYFDQLLITLERAPPRQDESDLRLPRRFPLLSEERDESICSTLLVQLQTIRRRLEASEDRMIRNIRSPLEQPDPVQESSQRIMEHEKLHQDLEDVKVDLSRVVTECSEVLAQGNQSGSSPMLSSELNHTTQKMDQLHSLSTIYLERLKNIDSVVRSSQGAETIVRTFENRLCEDDTLPTDVQGIEAYKTQLKQWRSEVEQKKAVFFAMEDELQRARSVNERMLRSHGERDVDLDQQRHKVEQLLERWAGVQTQIDYRLRELDNLAKLLRSYREGSGWLLTWVDDTLKLQEKLQATKIEDVRGLEEQLEREKSLANDIEKNQIKVDESQKSSDQYHTAAKEYEMHLLIYKATADTHGGLKSPIKRRRLVSTSDSVLQEYMTLRTRYTALVTMTSQYVKFLNETLKRLQDEQVSGCTLAHQKSLLDEELMRLKAEVAEAVRQKKVLEEELAKVRAQMEELIKLKHKTEEDNKKKSKEEKEKTQKIMEEEALKMKELAEEAARLRAMADEAMRQRHLAEEEATHQRAEAERILKEKLNAIQETSKLKAEAEITLKERERENERLKRLAEEEAHQRRMLQEQATQQKQAIEEEMARIRQQSDLEMQRQKALVDETIIQRRLIEEEIHILKIEFEKASKGKLDLEGELKRLKIMADETTRLKENAEEEANKQKKIAMDETMRKKEAQEEVSRKTIAEQQAAQQWKAAMEELEKLKRKADEAMMLKQKAEDEAARQVKLAHEAAQTRINAEEMARQAALAEKDAEMKKLRQREEKTVEQLRLEADRTRKAAEQAEKARIAAEKEASMIRQQAEEALVLKLRAEQEAELKARLQEEAEKHRREAEHEAGKRTQAEEAALRLKALAEAEAERQRRIAEETQKQKSLAEQELTRLRTILEDSDHQKSILEEELMRMKGEVAEAIRQKGLVEEELARLKAQMEELLRLKAQNEMDNRKRAANDSENMKKMLEEEAAKMKQLAEEAGRLRTNSDESARLRKQAEEELAQQRALAERLAREKLQAIQEASQLRAEAQAVQRQFDQAQERAKKLSEDRTEIQKKLEVETQTFQRTLEQERQRQHEVNIEAERLRMLVSELTKERARAQEESISLKSQMDEINSKRVSAERHAQEKIQLLQKMDVQKSQTDSEASRLRATISELERERERLKKEAEKAHTEAHEQQVRMHTEFKEQEAQLCRVNETEARKQKAMSDQEFGRLKAQLEDQEKQKGLISQQVNEMNAALTKAQQEKLATEKTLEGLRVKSKSEEAARVKLESQVREMSARNQKVEAELKKCLRDAEQEVERQRQQAEELLRQKNQIEEQWTSATKSMQQDATARQTKAVEEKIMRTSIEKHTRQKEADDRMISTLKEQLEMTADLKRGLEKTALETKMQIEGTLKEKAECDRKCKLHTEQIDSLTARLQQALLLNQEKGKTEQEAVRLRDETTVKLDKLKLDHDQELMRVKLEAQQQALKQEANLKQNLERKDLELKYGLEEKETLAQELKMVTCKLEIFEKTKAQTEKTMVELKNKAEKAELEKATMATDAAKQKTLIDQLKVQAQRVEVEMKARQVAEREGARKCGELEQEVARLQEGARDAERRQKSAVGQEASSRLQWQQEMEAKLHRTDSQLKELGAQRDAAQRAYEEAMGLKRDTELELERQRRRVQEDETKWEALRMEAVGANRVAEERYAENQRLLDEVSKQKLTVEVLASRLKADMANVWGERKDLNRLTFKTRSLCLYSDVAFCISQHRCHYTLNYFQYFPKNNHDALLRSLLDTKGNTMVFQEKVRVKLRLHVFRFYARRCLPLSTCEFSFNASNTDNTILKRSTEFRFKAFTVKREETEITHKIEIMQKQLKEDSVKYQRERESMLQKQRILDEEKARLERTLETELGKARTQLEAEARMRKQQEEENARLRAQMEETLRKQKLYEDEFQRRQREALDLEKTRSEEEKKRAEQENKELLKKLKSLEEETKRQNEQKKLELEKLEQERKLEIQRLEEQRRIELQRIEEQKKIEMQALIEKTNATQTNGEIEVDKAKTNGTSRGSTTIETTYMYSEIETQKEFKNAMMEIPCGQFSGKQMSVWEVLYNTSLINENKRNELISQYRTGKVTIKRIIIIVIEIITRITSFSFDGLRRKVTLQELMNSGLITQKTANELESGTTSVEEVSHSIRNYLDGFIGIAGLYVEATKEKLSIYSAIKRGLLRPGTGLVLLEAQAATGFIVDPVRNLKLSVDEAAQKALVGQEYRDKLLSAERAVTGYKDPYSGKTISLFQAMKKGLILKDHGIRLLEAQIATGGIIDPQASHRLPVEVAYKRGLFDKEMNQILLDPSDDTKGFFDPNTEENLTYLDLMQRCITDADTGLCLLPLKEKKKERKMSSKSSVRKRRVIIIDPDTNRELTVSEAYRKGLIDHETYVQLSGQECEWEEIITTGSDGVVTSVLVDRRSGRQYSVEEAIAKGSLDPSAIEMYRSGQLSITDFGDLLTGIQSSKSTSSIQSKSSSFPMSPLLSPDSTDSIWSDPTEESSAIGGILDTQKLEKISVAEAMRRKLVDNFTGQRLVEAQACTGGILDPFSGKRYTIKEAVTEGLIDSRIGNMISASEKAFIGFEDPITKAKLGILPAMNKGLLTYESGRRYLEAQYLTGGMVEPGNPKRLTLEEALPKGLVDQSNIKKLRDVATHFKYLTCPKTRARMSYKDALDRSMVDADNGIRLLEASGVISSSGGLGSAYGSLTSSKASSRQGSRRGSIDLGSGSGSSFGGIGSSGYSSASYSSMSYSGMGSGGFSSGSYTQRRY
ncbi:unnamed protein product [Lampetra fluviatilis]